MTKKNVLFERDSCFRKDVFEEQWITEKSFFFEENRGFITRMVTGKDLIFEKTSCFQKCAFRKKSRIDRDDSKGQWLLRKDLLFKKDHVSQRWFRDNRRRAGFKEKGVLKRMFFSKKDSCFQKDVCKD